MHIALRKDHLFIADNGCAYHKQLTVGKYHPKYDILDH